MQAVPATAGKGGQAVKIKQLRWQLRIAGVALMECTAPTAALRFFFIVRRPKQGRRPPWRACMLYAWYNTLANGAAKREQQARKANAKWLDAGHKYAWQVYG